jgi:senataxin
MWKAWAEEMALLLGLGAYYHVQCECPESCTRCKTTGLLQFTLISFRERFKNIYVLLRNILDYIIKKIPQACTSVSDLKRTANLLDTMARFEDLIHNDRLTDGIVHTAFGLVAQTDLPAEDNEYGTGQKLNETREECIRLLNSLCNSLILPKPRSRSELEIFCIKYSLVVVSTTDCASQLHGIHMEPFHAFIVGDAGLINDNELLIPLLLPLRHTIFLGDHKHLQPFVQSKVQYFVYLD